MRIDPQRMASSRGYLSLRHKESAACSTADAMATIAGGQSMGGMTSFQERMIQVGLKAVVQGAYQSSWTNQNAMSRIATPWIVTSVPTLRHRLGWSQAQGAIPAPPRSMGSHGKAR
jgi:hypothetical protein